MTRPVPQQAVSFISKHEGRRLEPYRDSAGHWTIGVGHLLALDPQRTIPASQFKPITEEMCDALLRADLARFARVVDETVTVDLNDNQFTACLSLAFNIGPEAFRRSTLVKKLQADDFEGAAAEFAKWNRAGGRVVQGLVNRRAAEAELFRTGADHA